MSFVVDLGSFLGVCSGIVLVIGVISVGANGGALLSKADNSLSNDEKKAERQALYSICQLARAGLEIFIVLALWWYMSTHHPAGQAAPVGRLERGVGFQRIEQLPMGYHLAAKADKLFLVQTGGVWDKNSDFFVVEDGKIKDIKFSPASQPENAPNK